MFNKTLVLLVFMSVTSISFAKTESNSINIKDASKSTENFETDESDIINLKLINQKTKFFKGGREVKDLSYEITYDTSKIDFADFKGVILSTYEFACKFAGDGCHGGNKVSREFYSNDPERIAEFMNSFKEVRHVEYSQALKYTAIGCFMEALTQTTLFDNCIYRKETPIPNIFYTSPNRTIEIKLINKNEMSGITFIKKEIPLLNGIMNP
jgi:hypothetical protein